MIKVMGYVSLLGLLASPAFAQERRQFGLNFSTGSRDSAIGATWHLTDRLALRPTFSFDHDRSEEVAFRSDTAPVTTVSTSSRVGAGLGVLLYMSRSEGLSTYLTGSYQRTHRSLQLEEGRGTSTSNGNVVSGGFGVQHAFTKRLSAFAEAGLSYANTRNDNQAAAEAVDFYGGYYGTPGSSRHFGTLSTSVGAIFYLK